MVHYSLGLLNWWCHLHYFNRHFEECRTFKRTLEEGGGTNMGACMGGGEVFLLIDLPINKQYENGKKYFIIKPMYKVIEKNEVKVRFNMVKDE